MSPAVWTAERAAGSLLASSLIIGVIALTIMIASGVTAGSSAMIRGDLASAAPHATILRVLNLLFAVAWIVQMCGLALLTRLLMRSGQEQLVLVAFTLVLIATLLAILDATFRMSVELWAAQEARAPAASLKSSNHCRRGPTSSFELAILRIYSPGLDSDGESSAPGCWPPGWPGRRWVGVFSGW